MRVRLDLHLGADRDDTVGGQVEEPGGTVGAPVEEHEEMLPPRLHPLDLVSDHQFVAKEERRLAHVERSAG